MTQKRNNRYSVTSFLTVPRACQLTYVLYVRVAVSTALPCSSSIYRSLVYVTKAVIAATASLDTDKVFVLFTALQKFCVENLKCNITPSLRALSDCGVCVAIRLVRFGYNSSTGRLVLRVAPYFLNKVLSLFSHTLLEEGKSALA